MTDPKFDKRASDKIVDETVTTPRRADDKIVRDEVKTDRVVETKRVATEPVHGATATGEKKSNWWLWLIPLLLLAALLTWFLTQQKPAPSPSPTASVTQTVTPTASETTTTTATATASS